MTIDQRTCSSGKVRYGKKPWAEVALRQMFWYVDCYDTHRLHTYLCGECSGWHIGRSSRILPLEERGAQPKPEPVEVPPEVPRKEDDGIPVGTILGTVKLEPLPAFPPYTPPEQPCRTVVEARARVKELKELSRHMQDVIDIAHKRKKQATLPEDYQEQHRMARKEKRELNEAITKLKIVESHALLEESQCTT